MPYAKSTLKGDLHAIKKHICSQHMGRAFDVANLAYVEKARQGINNCLDADNKTRAMSLEDSLVLRPAEGGGWEVGGGCRCKGGWKVAAPPPESPRQRTGPKSSLIKVRTVRSTCKPVCNQTGTIPHHFNLAIPYQS